MNIMLCFWRTDHFFPMHFPHFQHWQLCCKNLQYHVPKICSFFDIQCYLY